MTRFLAWLDAPGSGLPSLAALLVVVLVVEVWSRRTQELAQRRAVQDALTDKMEAPLFTIRVMEPGTLRIYESIGSLRADFIPGDPPPVSDAMRVKQVLHDAGLHREVEGE